jgi:hypothetical protein
MAKDMLHAALPILKQDAPGIAAFAEGEFKKIAQQLVTIESELHEGQINQEQAKILIEMQKSASRVVLLTAKGLSMLTVEKALNAALDVVRTAVNTAAKVAIL